MTKLDKNDKIEHTQDCAIEKECDLLGHGFLRSI